jgi:hypothetical protein
LTVTGTIADRLTTTGLVFEGASITGTGSTIGFGTSVVTMEIPFREASAVALTIAESGTTVLVGTSAVTQPLPAPTNGVWYRFVKNSLDNAVVINAASAGDLIGGVIGGGANEAIVTCTGNNDNLNFTTTTDVLGDYAMIQSDGSKWYVTGMVTAAAAITCTD